MNIYQAVRDEKIVEGSTFKNYKELCDVCQMPVADGHSKAAQLKELSRYIDYRRSGHQFIVTKIKECPDDKKDKRIKGNRGIYCQCIEVLLLNYFIKCNNKEVYLSRNELFAELGMINANYLKMEGNKDFVYQVQQINPEAKQWHIDQFYMRTRRKLNSIIRQALNSLSNKKLISYHEVVVAFMDGKYIIADDEPGLVPKILKYERQTLLEIGCDSFADLIFNKCQRKKYKQYIDRRNELLKKNLNIDFCFTKYKIFACDSNKYLNDERVKNIAKIKKSLNIKIKDYVNYQAENEYNKNLVKYANDEGGFLYPECYIPIQKLLANELIDLNANIIPDYEIPIIESEDLNIFG